MNVVMRSVLALWVCTFTLVRCQDCTKDGLEQKMKEGNMKGFVTSSLRKEYSHDAWVRVSCDIGHEGYYRAQCKHGTWVPRRTNVQCTPKSCGHPEDSPNADFTLEVGTDFVFASTVKYECQKGYVMVSRTSTRSCLDKGWSNTVPVCEAMQCPMFEVDDNINVYGNYDEATYGNVIQFQCKLNTMIISGSTQMYCGEHGDWVGTKPTCKDIECENPSIKDGEVTPGTQKYKEYATLDYTCNDGYRKPRASKTPKCNKKGINEAGWNPTPECEKITCELPSLQTAGTSYDSTQTRFAPGENLVVSCSPPDSYWIKNSHETSTTVACLPTGQWNKSIFDVQCEEVYCEKPSDDLNLNTGSRNMWKKDEMASFSCKRGYEPLRYQEAKCTRYGWSPKLHCKEITCPRPIIEDADILDPQPIYKFNAKLTYQCHVNFIPEKRKQVTCNQDGFKITKCVGKKGTCFKPTIENGVVLFNNTAPVKLHYSCHKDFKPFTEQGWWVESVCESGGSWSKPLTCIENEACRPLPEIPHSKPFKYSARGEFKCEDGYTSEIKSITCENGQWKEIPMCKPSKLVCKAPTQVENAVVDTKYQKEYMTGVQLRFKCRNESFTMSEGASITCKDGTWDPAPPNCTKITCELPSQPTVGTTYNPTQSTFAPGENLTVSCNATEKYWLKNSHEESTIVTCQHDGLWNKLDVQCEEITCELPSQPTVGTTYNPTQSRFAPGENLTVSCNTTEKYWIKNSHEESTIVTCQHNGLWNKLDVQCEEIPSELPSQSTPESGTPSDKQSADELTQKQNMDIPRTSPDQLKP